jgi:iron complex outermembrane receptor protein
VSVFGEWLLPLTDSAELNIAGRYDDYSDFGSAFSPSVGVIWNTTDSLALRARWGQGFKAPSLSSLNGPTTFSAETAFDPVTGTTRQFDTYYNTNPDLDAEESESYSLGANWEFFRGHSIDLAYWGVEIDNVIGFPSTQSLIYADSVGQSWPDDRNSVVRLGNGNIVEIQSFASNGSTLEATGIDFQWRSFFDTGIGMFNMGLFYTHQLTFKQNAYYKGSVQDTAGFYQQPTDRAQFTASWDLGDFGVDWIVDYIGPHSEEDFVDEATGKLTTSDQDLDSWTTTNLSGRWNAGRFGLFRIGCNNCTDEDPVLDKEGKYADGFPNLYNALGRVYFIEYKIKFD